tara:strand:- start:32 stop:307 length:276 start_codon:yes stop_codon:yes gene_type:complete
MFVTDFYEIADDVEQEIGVNMHLDIIFSDDLNHYFNYRYDYTEDVITLNFEVDKGTASIDIVNAKSANYSYRMNEILEKYVDYSHEASYQE